MKKVIALFIVTVICAGIFVGCGSGESTTSSIVSSQRVMISKYLPHSDKVTWSSTKSGIKSEEYGTFTDDSTYTIKYNIVIDSIIFDELNYAFDSNGNIQSATYTKNKIDSNYYHFIQKKLDKMYGENQEKGKYSTWKVELPTGEDCLISLHDDTDSKKEVELSYKVQRKSSTQTSSTVSSKASSSSAASSKPDSSKSTSSAKPSTPPKAEKPSTSPKAEAPSTTPPPSTTTAGQTNALKRAKSYLNTMAFSYKGLVKQLKYENFSNEDAAYGVDNCGANWNEQAVKKAKSYLGTMAFSYNGLVKQLEYEGFTHSQAVYGADNCAANWNEQAAKKAKSYLNTMSFSRAGLIKQLEYEGFTHAQAAYGVDQAGL